MASPVDDGELWRVGTRESKGFCKTKDKNALVFATVYSGIIYTRLMTNSIISGY